MRIIDADNFNTYNYIIPTGVESVLEAIDNIPTFIPDGCKKCSNHPSNGGSGICHCILGVPRIY